MSERMAFKSTGKGLQRRQSLQTRKPLQSHKPLKTQAQLSPEQKREQDKKALQKRTLRALEKARALAAEQRVDLSEWESEFLSSVAERVKTYGRAFADPDKGAMGGTLSLRQGVKLREIRRKASTTSAPKADTDDDD